jgi:hypothetical protein
MKEDGDCVDQCGERQDARGQRQENAERAEAPSQIVAFRDRIALTGLQI